MILIGILCGLGIIAAVKYFMAKHENSNGPNLPTFPPIDSKPLPGQPQAPSIQSLKFKPFWLMTKESLESSGPFQGLWKLRLRLVTPDGDLGAIYAHSGLPGRQEFHTGPYSAAGSGQPLPQGYWKIGSEAWNAGQDNFNSYFNPGLGPVVWDLIPQFETERSAIEVHYDANWDTSSGTN